MNPIPFYGASLNKNTKVTNEEIDNDKWLSAAYWNYTTFRTLTDIILR
jgi:hypothetical protein